MNPVCRFLGHSFNETTLEERREEHQGETVLVTTEYRICARCGKTKEIYSNQGVIGPAPTDSNTIHDNELPSQPRSEVNDRTGADESMFAPDRSQETEPSSPMENTDNQEVTTSSDEAPKTGDQPAEGTSSQDTGVEIISDSSKREPETDQKDSTSPSTSSDESPTSTQRPRSTVRYQCQNCGYEAPANPTAYMAGDICTNCHNGYIERIDDGLITADN